MGDFWDSTLAGGRQAMNVSRGALVIVLAFLAGSGLAGAVELEANQAYDRLPGTVVTPHIPWAKPYYQGALKTLVIAPTWTQRETVELAQRLSLDYSPLMTFSETDFFKSGYATVREEVVNRVAEERLREDYDLIIIGKMDWSALPSSVRYAVIKKVHAGAGMVYISPKGVLKELETLFTREKAEDEEGFITSGVPLSVLPVVDRVPEEKLVSLSVFGKGRIARIEYGQGRPRASDYSYHSLTPFGVYNEPSVIYDYYHSLLAKACLWAARREPDIYIKGITLPPGPIMREKLLSSTVAVSAVSREAGASGYDISLIIRDWKNVVEHEKSAHKTLRQGANEVIFELPVLKDGPHVCDVWFRKDGKVVNWGSAVLTVKSKVRIEKLILDRSSFEAGEEVTGKVVLSGPSSGAMKLSVEVSDGYGRLIGREVLSPSGKEASFALRVLPARSTFLIVRAMLEGRDGIAGEMTVETLMPLREKRDFSFVMWDFVNNDHILQAHLREYEKHGVDTILVPNPHRFPTREENEEICRHMTRANLDIIPYIGWFGDEGGTGFRQGPDGPIRTKCFTDPGYRRSVAGGSRGLAKNAEFLKPFGPPAYSVGNENVLSGGGTGVDICFSPTCLADFRKYAQRVYGGLGALNKEWGTSYSDWGQVKPLSLKEAKKQGNYPRWVDHRMHMDEVYAGIHRFARDVIRRVDPGARVGWEGSYGDGSIYRGYDFFQLYGILDLKNSNASPGGYDYELQCSYTRRGDHSSADFGSYEGAFVGTNAAAAEQNMRYFPWFCLFHNMNACWWWYSFPYNGCGGASAFTPDFAPLPGFAQASEEVMEIKRGIGKLLLNGRRDDSGVVIHYSRPSTAVSMYRGEHTKVKESFQDFRYALEDLGRQYYCMHREELEAGKLTAGGYRLLVLPYSQALSLMEANEIKKFVRAGGCVITDFDPGVTDEHGKVLPGSSLAEVFPRMGAAAYETTYGKGKAFYFGDRIRGYAGRRRAGKGMEALSAVSAALKTAGVIPGVTATVVSSGERLKATEVTTFRNGEADYVCLLRDHRVNDLSTREVELRFSREAFVYDVREKKAFGRTRVVRTMLLPARAKVFALLPYELKRVTVRADRQRYRQGKTAGFEVRLEVSAGRPSAHVVRVELYGPGGEELSHYARNMLIEEGRGSGVIPLALDEKEGEYRIVVTDAATGMEAEEHFTVTRG